MQEAISAAPDTTAKGRGWIEKVLPHRWPFLYVREVLELDDSHVVARIGFPWLYWIAIKIGHFGVVRGVELLEAMAQVGAIMVLTMPQNTGKLALFRRASDLVVDDVVWRGRVEQGQTVVVEATYKGERKGMYSGSAIARVGEAIVCTVDFRCGVIESNPTGAPEQADETNSPGAG